MHQVTWIKPSAKCINVIYISMFLLGLFFWSVFGNSANLREGFFSVSSACPPPASTLRADGTEAAARARQPWSTVCAESATRAGEEEVVIKRGRRIQLTQQRALQLQDENHRLQLHIQHLSHEVDSLRHYLSQRHLQASEQDAAGDWSVWWSGFNHSDWLCDLI